VARLATRTWGDAGPAGTGDGDAAARVSVGAGGRRPLAVLVHGVTSSSRTWWRVAPVLVSWGFRVLAVDLRGHGSSERVSEGLGLPDLAADLAATIQAHLSADVPGTVPDGTSADPGADVPGTVPIPAGGTGGPAVDLLVGHSLGALVVGQLLATRPGLTRRLVLEDPPGLSTADWAALADGIEADGARARMDPEGLWRDLHAESPGSAAGEVERRIADLADCDTVGIAAGLRRQVVYDLPSLMRALRVPTLLLVGEEALGSALVGPDRGALIEALDQGTVEVLRAGHNLHREAFDAFMAAIERWLGEEAGLRSDLRPHGRRPAHRQQT
jgi:pimeloyl-ACP methyl ester carboxylesterase